ncbi:hypothetical protein KI388_02710 [Halorubrum sp. 2020YC2]|nr:hypothetical protein KI388_02710 [Halorubrum sp. 2020YC2]
MREWTGARVGSRDRDRSPADSDLGGETRADQLRDCAVRDGLVREAAGDAEGVADPLDLDEQPPVRRVDRGVDAVDR